jgi:hypothetical protein
MPIINDAGDISYGSELEHMVAQKIKPLVRNINELVAAWEKSQPMPYDNLSDYNILTEFADTLLTACDRTESGHGMDFGIWKYSDDGTGVNSIYFTKNYAEAKEIFSRYARLIPKEKCISREQAEVIKKALDFSLENCQSFAYARKFTEIIENLSRAYPEIFNPKEKPPKSKSPRNSTSLHEKLDTAKKVAKKNDAKKGNHKSKNEDERE